MEPIEDILAGDSPRVSGDFVIAVRPHLAGGLRKHLEKIRKIDPDNAVCKRLDWVYNDSHVLNKETANTLAKSGHGPCGGKGWREEVVPSNGEFFDRICFCECALRNSQRLGA